MREALDNAGIDTVAATGARRLCDWPGKSSPI